MFILLVSMAFAEAPTRAVIPSPTVPPPQIPDTYTLRTDLLRSQGMPVPTFETTDWADYADSANAYCSAQHSEDELIQTLRVYQLATERSRDLVHDLRYHGTRYYAEFLVESIEEERTDLASMLAEFNAVRESVEIYALSRSRNYNEDLTFNTKRRIMLEDNPETLAQEDLEQLCRASFHNARSATQEGKRDWQYAVNTFGAFFETAGFPQGKVHAYVLDRYRLTYEASGVWGQKRLQRQE